jgi:hypothetical protein
MLNQKVNKEQELQMKKQAEVLKNEEAVLWEYSAGTDKQFKVIQGKLAI